jgi:hypothetical protein
MLWQAAAAAGCRCSEIDLVNMWKSGVSGPGGHEMGVMRTKGRARFVTHLEDRDSVNEEFLAREFGNFLEERMGVRLEERGEMHTDGLLGAFGHAIAKGVSGIQNAVLPSKAVKAERAIRKAAGDGAVARLKVSESKKRLQDEIDVHEKAQEQANSAAQTVEEELVKAEGSHPHK